MSDETIKNVGPFTWRRDDEGNDESWELVIPEGTKLSHFSVKNYGGKPNDGSGFSGWRVVGGGPFTRAGGWTSRQAAMRGAIPFLLDFYRREVTERMADAKRAERALLKWSRELGA